jgi:hypothetical protein
MYKFGIKYALLASNCLTVVPYIDILAIEPNILQLNEVRFMLWFDAVTVNDLSVKSLFNRKIKKRDSAALSMPHPSKEKCNLISRKEKRNVNIDRKCPT